MPDPVTLQDIAREAEVAVSTASRALSNPDRVSRATRERVQTVARRLGYRPGRGVGAGGRGHRLLALAVNDITNPHNFDLIRGAEAQARAAGYTLIIGETRESQELELDHAARLDPVVDGFVLAASRLSDDELRTIAQRDPVALYNREVAGIASVVGESADSARQVVEHLVALGHRSLAFLAGPDNAWSSTQRWRGLSAAARRAGVDVVRLGPFLPTRDQGPAAADVALATPATALIAFNDLLAIGVLQRLRDRGVDVPGRVSVVGYDNIFGADFCHPTLTTVAGQGEAAGRLLVDLVLQSGSRAPAPIVLPSELLIRHSTGQRTG